VSKRSKISGGHTGGGAGGRGENSWERGGFVPKGGGRPEVSKTGKKKTSKGATTPDKKRKGTKKKVVPSWDWLTQVKLEGG